MSKYVSGVEKRNQVVQLVGFVRGIHTTQLICSCNCSLNSCTNKRCQISVLLPSTALLTPYTCQYAPPARHTQPSFVSNCSTPCSYQSADLYSKLSSCPYVSHICLVDFLSVVPVHPSFHTTDIANCSKLCPKCPSPLHPHVTIFRSRSGH